MGLDVTAYSNLTQCAADEVAAIDRDYPPDGVMNVWRYPVENSGWDARAEPFDGLCRTTGKTQKHCFYAGSYSSYSWWRDVLSTHFYGVPAYHVWANRDDYRDLPFFELIDFSDCEGYIGATVAAKLAADFKAYRAAASSVDVGEHWLEQYENWARAFAVAARGGVVEFH